MTMDTTRPDVVSPTTTDSGQWVRTSELRPLLATMRALCEGDFTARADGSPEEGEAAPKDPVVAEMGAVLNQIIARNDHLATELQRVRHEIIRRGLLDERISASPGAGTWTTSVEAANTAIEALVGPVAKATRVLDAVADGDLTQHVDLHDGSRQLRGDLRRLGIGVNRMVDQLSLFTGEVTRVAREVGTEGRLGAVRRRRACPETGST